MFRPQPSPILQGTNPELVNRPCDCEMASLASQPATPAFADWPNSPFCSMRAWLALLLVLSTAIAVEAAPLHFDTGKQWQRIPYSLPPTQHAVQYSAVAFGDVNGDGKADMVLYNSQFGEAWVMLSTGISFGAPALFATGLPKFTQAVLSYTIGVSDVNGDGRADLLIFNHGADNVPGAATATVALSTGTHFVLPANPVWNASWCANYQRCLYGDVNGDGKGDMVAFTPSYGTVWASLSQGSSFGPNAIWNNYFCIQGEDCALGDVDGDGKADAILFKPHAPAGQKGNVLWARSTGSAFVNVKYGHGYFCIDFEQCLVGDVNGDHKTDIVLLKGFGTTASSLEVLVSLSNGTQFINATPFTWANIPYSDPLRKVFGSFALADVTGDGKADLVEWGTLSNQVGTGSFQTTDMVVYVFPVTDKPLPGPPSGGGNNPPSASGFSSVRIYNCQADQDRLYFWNADQTAHTTSQTGLTDAMYSIDGTCPDPNDAPQTFSLASGHTYLVAAVDPSAIGCDGQNDPNVVACNIGTLALKGLSTGPVCNWIVSAQTPACDVTLKTQSFTGHLSGGSAGAACAAGLVWRKAAPSDHVCVTPEARADILRENAAASSRSIPSTGACLAGFVWRQAFPSDRVCVPPASRDRVKAENLATKPRIVEHP